ncbi:hypothetical protein Tco_0629998, partial [Tanacetum coccineum]
LNAPLDGGFATAKRTHCGVNHINKHPFVVLRRWRGGGMVTVARRCWWLSAGDGGDDEMMAAMEVVMYTVVRWWCDRDDVVKVAAVCGCWYGGSGGDRRWEMEASVLCRCGVDDDGGVAGIWPERG